MKYANVIKNSPKYNDCDIKESLLQINQFTRRPLSESEVFIFSIILCDNNIDRDFEKFSDSSLDILKSLFLGKTGVFDHMPTGYNQTSRIFFTEVVIDSLKTNSIGQPYKYLLAKAYMVKSDKNRDLILEIDAGIKKEISIGCSVKSKICSICGADHKIRPCSHIPGKSYIVKDKHVTCFLSLEQPLDAYEWSFVAVPAQVNAGVIKNFTDFYSKSPIVISSIDPMEIKKSFASISETNQHCLISSLAVKSLNNYISKLETNSEIALSSINDLKTQVYKMLSIDQSTLSSSTINTIIDKLSYQELKNLKSDLTSKLDVNLNSLQLSPSYQADVDSNDEDNTMFSI